MTGKAKQAYLFIFIVLLFFLSASKMTTERSRGATASLIAPIWEKITNFKLLMQTPFSRASDEKAPTKNGVTLSLKEEIARLKLENQMLKGNLEELQEILQREHFLENAEISDQEIAERHKQEVIRLLEDQVEAIPARVIFRSRLSWNSSLWINVGEAQNRLLGRTAIAKNSPVVIGTSVVGVVDYVGEHQSRIRLITDSGLTPSVRAVRGDMQNRVIAQQIDTLLDKINRRPDLFNDTADRQFKDQLIGYREKLNREKGTFFLAKGELQGSSKPLWRTQSQVLKGIGFNYDFADDEGPARELRSGKPLGGSKLVPTMAILNVGDLLITSGLDGVFPAGLQVAEVTKINPLREGDYYYELEANPTAGNLDELGVVFVMPPIGYKNE